MKKLQLLNKYKYKSVFFQIVLILSAFSLFSIIIFLNFSFNLATKTVHDKNSIMYTNILNNAKNSLDSSLKGLHDIITHTTSERSIMNAVVIPHSVSNSNDLEVLITLSTLSEENELINDVYLYIPANNKVFTSQYEVIDRKHFYNNDILDSYYTTPDTGSSIELNGRVTRILLYNSEIYLVRDFPLVGDRRLGTIFAKLDTNKLYSVLQGQGVNYSNNLLVYDSMNNPVFPNNISYSDTLNKYIETISPKDESVELVDNNRNFYTESSITQFRFLFVIDDTSFMPSAKQIFESVFPLGISILFICLLLALFLTNKVYSPIKQLVSNVENASLTKALTSSKNEFDYLNGTFSNVFNRYSDFDRVIQNILPEISGKMFNDLLMGKPMETSYIESTLKSISSPLDTKGIYNVMVLKLEQNITADNLDLFLVTVVQILDEKVANTCRYHIQMTEKAVLTVLLEFEKNVPELNIKMFELDIEKHIVARSKNLHLDVLSEKGKVYHSIQEVQFSYEEALQQLDMQNNCSDEPENVTIQESINENSQPYYSKDYFTIRINKIYELILDNDDTGALLLAKQISKSIAESDASIEKVRSYYNIYIDSILEKMLSFNINTAENIFLPDPQTDNTFNTAEDSAEMQQFMDNFCEQAIHLVTEYYRKQQHKYIISAKKYIEANYSDPNLSLSSVADYVDTNTSYLSKLFKTNLNVNFNDYLNSYRIEKAKSYLSASGMTVKDIANATGFNSQQNFIRVFKKFEGITPSQYKK